MGQKLSTPPPAQEGTSDPSLLPPIADPDEVVRNLNRPRNSFRVQIKTGNRPFAGTSAEVFLQLKFDNGEMTELLQMEQLNEDINYFQQGRTDHFFVYHDVPDTVHVKEIVLKHNNKGFASGWFVDTVEIQNLKTFNQYNFECNDWVSKCNESGVALKELTCKEIRSGQNSSIAAYLKQRAQFKTGDLIMYSSRYWHANFTKFYTRSPYTHVGILFPEPETGRWLSFESTDDQIPRDYYPFTSRYIGVHCFDADERVNSYNGDAWHLPIKRPLNNEDVERLWTYLQAHRARRSAFDFKALFNAGVDWFDGIGLTLNRENFHTMVCSGFVAGAFKELRMIPQTVNVSEQTPADLTKFSCVQTPIIMRVLDPITNFPLQLQTSMETGDIILINQRKRFRKLWKLKLKHRWTHVGVVVKSEENGLTKYEAFFGDERTGRVVDFYEFLTRRQVKAVAVRHFSNKTSGEAQAAGIEYMKKQLNTNASDKHRSTRRTVEFLKALQLLNDGANANSVVICDFTSQGQTARITPHISNGGTLYNEIFIRS